MQVHYIGCLIDLFNWSRPFSLVMMPDLRYQVQSWVGALDWLISLTGLILLLLHLGYLPLHIRMPQVYEENDTSLVMRKPDFCICENKDADQLRGNREADQRLCFRYTDTGSTIPLLSKSKISSLKPSSVGLQPGFCQTWSKTLKTSFLTTRLIQFYGPLSLFQTDLFGLAGTIHVLAFDQYMNVYQSGGEWCMTKSFTR